MSVVLGLDIGGTSLKLGAWAADELLAWRDGLPLPQSTDPEVVIGRLAEVVGDFASLLDQQPDALGVGSCGLISDGVVHQSPNTPWQRLPLGPRLAEELSGVLRPGHGGVRHIFVINDADAFLLDALAQEPARVDSALGITLGTGLGTAVWLGGRLVSGGSGISPEGGHISLDLDGAPANTGIPGSFESLACGAAVLRYYSEAGGDPAAEPRDVATAAAEKDAAALEAWRRFGRCLGAGLGSLCNVFSPEVVLIGGGLASAEKWFAKPLRQALDRHLLSAFPRPVVRFLVQRPQTVAHGAARYAAMMLDHA
jgi:glucokinase